MWNYSFGIFSGMSGVKLHTETPCDLPGEGNHSGVAAGESSPSDPTGESNYSGPTEAELHQSCSVTSFNLDADHSDAQSPPAAVKCPVSRGVILHRTLVLGLMLVILTTGVCTRTLISLDHHNTTSLNVTQY